MKISIGIDVSKSKLNVCCYDGHNFFFEREYLNSEKGFKEIAELFKDSDSIITMEATGNYHLKLAKYLLENERVVSAVNALKIKKFVEMRMFRAKTDKADARAIASYGYQEKPCFYKPVGELEEKIKILVQAIEDLVETKTQYNNRLLALDYNTCEINDVSNSYRFLLKSISDQIKSFECEIERLINIAYPVEGKMVNKIAGVGKRAKAVIFGHLNGFKYFDHAKQVSAYMGLNPCPKQSGTSVKSRGAISRQGNSYLRGLFYMLGITAIKHNPQCKKFYERLRQAGKPFKVANIAVANKLLRQIFAVVKYKREYDPNYDEYLRKNHQLA